MAAPLQNCTTRVAFCNNIFVFRSSETVRDSQQYGERKVCQWVERFHEDRTSVVDGHRSGRLCTAFSDANVAFVGALIGENRRISVATTATVLNISVASAHGIIHETLKYD
jgi:hypothetical protein